MAEIGRVSEEEPDLELSGPAGRTALLGLVPLLTGKAMRGSRGSGGREEDTDAAAENGSGGSSGSGSDSGR